MLNKKELYKQFFSFFFFSFFVFFILGASLLEGGNPVNSKVLVIFAVGSALLSVLIVVAYDSSKNIPLGISKVKTGEYHLLSIISRCTAGPEDYFFFVCLYKNEKTNPFILKVNFKDFKDISLRDKIVSLPVPSIIGERFDEQISFLIAKRKGKEEEIGLHGESFLSAYITARGFRF